MNWTIASMMAPVEMASMRETKLRSMLNCAPSNGSTMKRAIRIAIPYGSSRASSAAAAHGHFAGLPPPDQSLVNIGDADPKQWRGHIRASPRINGRNHTLTQVLRIWLARHNLRVDSTRKLNHKSSTARNPPILSTLKML